MFFLLFPMLLFLPCLGVAKDIYVGMSAALTGPTGFLGREMKLGIESAFYEANSQGGINKNILHLITMDDKYEPFYTELNMKRFASDENFISVLGNVGTPTSKVALPVAKENNLPFIGALSGSNILRKNPLEPYIINYRASYEEEIGSMMEALLSSGISVDELAFFTQDDYYGDSGYLGVIKSLNKSNIEIDKIQSIPHGRYIRNTIYVEEGLDSILQEEKDIKAFIMVGTYKPVAKFIKLAKEHYPSAYFLSVSFVGDGALQNELCLSNDFLCHEYTHNVIVTSVVPYLKNNVPIVKEYKDALRKYVDLTSQEKKANSLADFERKPNSISFEGYIAAKMFLFALEKAGNQPDRESLLAAFKKLGDFDLGLGYKLNISEKNNQASSAVFPVILKKNHVNKFDWENITKKENLRNNPSKVALS